MNGKNIDHDKVLKILKINLLKNSKTTGLNELNLDEIQLLSGILAVIGDWINNDIRRMSKTQ